MFCLGLQLTCMNDILKAIGKYNTVGPEKKPCLAACEDQVCVCMYVSPRNPNTFTLCPQVNSVSVSSSNFPNRETFIKRDDFCILVNKLIKTCTRNKYYVLQKYYPEICNYIYDVKSNATPGTFCQNDEWDTKLMGYKLDDVR